MSSVLECLPSGSRVVVIRLRSLGDCVLTTPALGILKRARPDLRVAVVVEDRFRAVFEDNSDINEIRPPRIEAMRRFRPQLAINFHGGTRSAMLSAFSGARWRAGFGHFRHAFLYNLKIPRAQQILGVERKVHTAEHLASAMFWLGAPAGEIPRAKLAPGPGLPAGLPPAGPYAVIHPVAASPEKTWRAEGFLAVAEHLKQSGLDPIFIGAAADDLSRFRAFRILAGAPLAEIKTLLSRCALFLGNDSGPAHIAAAFGVPAVVVFGSSDPAIWGPWRAPAEIVTSPGGIAEVTTAQVVEALARLRVPA